MRVLVAGGISCDVRLGVVAAPAVGETVPAETVGFLAGGSGVGLAVACSKLAAQTAIVGCVGGDEHGRMLLQTLRDARVDTRHLLASNAPTAMTVTTRDSDGYTRTVACAGANTKVTPDMVARALANSWDALLLTTELPDETVAASVDMAAAKAVPVVLRPTLPGRLVKLPGVSVLVVDELTALRLTGSNETETVMNVLAGYAPTVVVTTEKHGALLCRDGRVVRYPIAAVSGTGDVFAAAFTLRYAQRRDCGEAAAFAGCACALCVRPPNEQLQLPKLTQVMALFDSQRVTTTF